MVLELHNAPSRVVHGVLVEALNPTVANWIQRHVGWLVGHVGGCQNMQMIARANTKAAATNR